MPDGLAIYVYLSFTNKCCFFANIDAKCSHVTSVKHVAPSVDKHYKINCICSSILRNVVLSNYYYLIFQA